MTGQLLVGSSLTHRRRTSRSPLTGSGWRRAAPLPSLVRRTAWTRERGTITDHDEPAAVVISADELEDLEDELAIAQSLLREARGETTWVPHNEVKQRLGLDR